MRTRLFPVRRIRIVLLGAVVVVAIYWVGPLVLAASARLLIRTDEQQRADFVIALAGDPRCLREENALALYQRGLVQTIVVSGVPSSWSLHTGEAARHHLLRRGVPDRDIVVLRESRNTRQEAAELVALMRSRGWGSGVIVTSPFHSRRAFYTISRAAPDFAFYSRPVRPEAPEWNPERWWTRRTDAYLTVREWLAWVNTLVGGLS